VLGPGGDAVGVFELIGVDPIIDASFRGWTFVDDDGGLADSLIAEAGATLMEAGTAARLGLGEGDRFALRADGREHAARLAAVARADDPLDREALAGVLAVDVATAQEWLGRIGRLSRIDLILPEGEAGEAAARRIAALLEGGAELVPAGIRAGAQHEMVRAFGTNLTALSLLALLVGAFLVYSTMTVRVVQRRERLGTLRCLGLGRGQVLAGVLGQAAVLAVTGTLLGLVLGYVLAHGLVGLVTRTITDLYFVVEVRTVTLAPWAVAKGLLLGLGVSVTAAAAPAIEAAWIAPRALAQRSDLEQRARQVARLSGLAAPVVLAVGAGILVLSGRNLVAAFAALFLLILGYALLIPAATGFLARAAAPLLGAVAGLSGRMAGGNVRASLSRTGVATAALAIAVSASIGVGVMIGSFRLSVTHWLDDYLRADVYLNLPDSRTGGTIAPRTRDAARRLPGVREVGIGRWLESETPDGILRLFAFETDRQGFDGFRFLAGDADEIWPRYIGGEAVIVSEPYAWHHGLALGDPVRLHAPGGPVALPIAGIFRDYGSDRGTVVIHRPAYERLFDDPTITSLGLYLDDGVDAGELARMLPDRLPGGADLRIRTVGALQSATLDVFDRTFLVTAVLRWLAMIVAGVGILSAVLALQWERMRELGVLRTLGFSPGQLRTLLGIEAGLLGLLAGLMAVPLGIAMAGLLVHVINRRAFGWTMDFTVDPTVVVQSVALALVTALVASVYPAWRSTRSPIPEALREE